MNLNLDIFFNCSMNYCYRICRKYIDTNNVYKNNVFTYLITCIFIQQWKCIKILNSYDCATHMLSKYFIAVVLYCVPNTNKPFLE